MNQDHPYIARSVPVPVIAPVGSHPHHFEPSAEPARRGERRACAVCGNSECDTIHD